MRPLVAVGVVLCLFGWLGIACQSRPTTPTSVQLPSATPVPTRTSTPTSVPSPTPTPTPSRTSTPSRTQTPTPTPAPLTDAEAILLVEEAAVARGVDLDTLRIIIGGEPRRASVHYSTPYSADGRAFLPQTVLIALASARVMVRVQPPIDGGIRLAAVPGGGGNVGQRVIVIDTASLEAWTSGSISDQEFVGQWMVWTVTKE